MEQNLLCKPLSLDLVFLYKLSIAIWKVTPYTLYSMTAKPGIISICNQIILILCIIKIDFNENTKNTFFESIRKNISKRLGYFNSIHIRKCEYKIVIKLNLSNLPILYKL